MSCKLFGDIDPCKLEPTGYTIPISMNTNDLILVYLKHPASGMLIEALLTPTIVCETDERGRQQLKAEFLCHTKEQFKATPAEMQKMDKW
jgi:hypothetical protein